MDCSDLRRQYTRGTLLEHEADPDPVRQFEHWFAQARSACGDSAADMCLATVGPDGRPSARMVLLRGFDERGAVFYTNHGGRKAEELDRNPVAALVLYWQVLERQVRVEGAVTRVSDAETARYFATRPRESQLAAWASQQSGHLPNREALEATFRAVHDRFAGREVPVPAFWGGYRVALEKIEFWQGREHRMHDRLLYERGARGAWSMQRLQP